MHGRMLGRVRARKAYCPDPAALVASRARTQESRLKNLSIRHNLAVRAGDGADVLYR